MSANTSQAGIQKQVCLTTKTLLFAAVCRDESKCPATYVYDNAHGCRHVRLEVLMSVQRCGVIHVA